MTVELFEFDPLSDSRWAELLERHSEASVFHTPGWLQALRDTYMYRPFVVTNSAPREPLCDGIVFCEVSSLLTGRRIVSLPFSDHCQPLVDSSQQLAELLAGVRQRYAHSGCRYIELRPRQSEGFPFERQPAFDESAKFAIHEIDLRPDPEILFAGFHRDSVQRRIRRAERASLEYECGRSESIVDRFYSLVLKTRRRQQLPPQPILWFRNLVRCLGDRLEIHLASEDSTPVAGILTMRFKDQLVYKYGASDARFNRLGATPWVFWKSIQAARERGLNRFDLGRSDLEHQGLIRFKAHWGSQESVLTYYRWPPGVSAPSERSWLRSAGGRVLSVLPDFAFSVVGRVFYRHFG